MRIFISLKTTPYEEELFKVESQIKPYYSNVKWVEKENLHITLKFLGEVDEEFIYNLNNIIQGISARFLPFSFSISGISGFPKLEYARVIFFSIEDQSAYISLIMREIDRALKDFGFEREKSYIPHITFGRVKNGAIDLSRTESPTLLIESKAIGIKVVQSILRPEGPLYKVISQFMFNEL